jgi:GTPase SAR1 family protein
MTYIEISARDSKNVERAFLELVRLIYNSAEGGE